MAGASTGGKRSDYARQYCVSLCNLLSAAMAEIVEDVCKQSDANVRAADPAQLAPDGQHHGDHPVRATYPLNLTNPRLASVVLPHVTGIRQSISPVKSECLPTSAN